MGPEQARKWLVISALVVAGVWGYRRLEEGAGSIATFPEFVAGWGAVYFTLALVSEAAPRFGGAMSILIMVGDVLHNANPGGTNGLLADINGQLSKNKAQSQPKPQTSATSTGSLHTHPAAAGSAR